MSTDNIPVRFVCTDEMLANGLTKPKLGKELRKANYSDPPTEALADDWGICEESEDSSSVRDVSPQPKDMVNAKTISGNQEEKIEVIAKTQPTTQDPQVEPRRTARGSKGALECCLLRE